MTNPVDTIDAGSGRIDPLVDALRTARPTGPSSADGATFAALVERASGHRPGDLVDDLPTGRAAESWARWQPPSGALGTRSAAAAAGVTGSATGLGQFGPLTGPHATGSVFPMAATAGEAAVNAAATHLGVPYLWGGTDAEHGFDCSGLIQDAYRHIGVELPKWSRHQATMGVEVPSIEAARPGDILTFGQPVNHVALYVGDNKMLHAPRTGEVVKIEEIDRPINSIRRVVDGVGTGGLGTASAFGAVGGSPIGSASAAVPTSTSASAPVGNATPFAELFETAGRRHNVDPALLAAVAKAESGFDTSAVSPVGAQGLMQFMPATAQEMGVDPWDPASAIDGAARYLRNSLDRFGSVDLAVASYNAGPGAVARHGGIPPYPETQNYVRTVLDAWRS